MAESTVKTAEPTASKPKDAKPAPPKLSEAASWRETIESVAMAVVLALLFKSFVAEAFVIPTGSMAPTLQGRHKDVTCPQCGYDYRTNASEEVDRVDGSRSDSHIVSCTCPICRFTLQLDPAHQANHGSFSGDRIIVSKFAYDFSSPQRWDVFVFKYPGDATQNYIKRLVGLPNETLKIVGGNVWTFPGEAEEKSRFQIARKPPHKLAAMLQIVDDSNHVPPLLEKLGWPARWRGWSAPDQPASGWTKGAEGKSYSLPQGAQTSWLRYQHLPPSHDDWKTLLAGNLPPGVASRPGSLITDFYAYNAGHSSFEPPASDKVVDSQNDLGPPPDRGELGLHWVDDLALECTAHITAAAAEAKLVLELVRAGAHHRCTIDLSTGVATFTITAADGKAIPFVGDDGASYAAVTAQTAVRGAGSHTLRLSNCDHEMLLWVDGSPVATDKPATYASYDIVAPHWTAGDPHDLAPAGVAASGAAVELSSLRVLRDKYYIAIDGGGLPSDYEASELRNPKFLEQIFSDPSRWESSGAFSPTQRRFIEFYVGGGQYLPLGDNSPASYDGRYWSAFDHVVEQDLLVGKAMVIYWPHTWNNPPFAPNFRRMGVIR